MNNEEDAAAWTGYHAKKENEALTTTVTEAGMNVAYGGGGNGWKGIVLKNAALNISKLTGKLSFTYSSDMAITSYRIHIQTDQGGSLTSGTYASASLTDITAGSAAAWTQTTNADGSVTVTFDLNTMGYFAEGTELKGLTIVTVTANGVTGTVTHKIIELEKIPAKHDCQVSGHIMKDATCTDPKTCLACGATEGEALGHDWVAADCDTPKTCSVCGETEGEALGHTWADADCDTPKTCSACGETEGEALGHSWSDATCQAPKTCSVCGTTEGELGGHADENGDSKCDVCEENLCTDHTWNDANCTTPKTCSICGTTEGEALGHDWADADCDTPKTCSRCGETEGEALGHDWADADCDTPKTCSRCGATEGEALGHDWADADCDTAKTCNTCGATEGEALGHNWSDATCQAPKTCSACGTTEGSKLPHADSNKDHVCDACSESLSVWYMNIVADASQWQNAQSYTVTKPSVTTAEVTTDGFKINYLHDNGWKGIFMKNVEIDIAGLSGILSFTYTEEMDITEYRVHVLTDKGGSLENNTSGTPSNYYAAISIGNIAQSSAWTQTTNADGSITVTFDLTTLSFFAEGAKLLGMDIVTVTDRGTKGNVTYKIIALESVSTEHNCQVSGHVMSDATCTAPKTCSMCGVTEGEALGHDWADADCDTPKTCSVCGETEGEALGHDWVDADCDTPKTCNTCGATEGEALGHTWVDATCQAPKTCSVCGATEGELGGHTDENADRKCDLCEENLCTDHSWKDATCTLPKTCEHCGETEGEALGHSWKDATCTTPKTCSACGATEGGAAGHNFVQSICTVCSAAKPAQNQWDMSDEADASDWAGYHAKVKDKALTTTVTAAGMRITYTTPSNGWKAIVLENTAIDIAKLTGKLSLTYSSDMTITSYRIHIQTDQGGSLTSGTYASASLTDITAGSAAAWTQTTNADGSITVTFDLSTMDYFANGTRLKGLSIVTVTANDATGTVTYKSIELEESPCWSDGHTWNDATCQAPKTCSVCGKTEGEVAEHTFAEGVCTVCGAAESTPATPIVWNMSNTDDAGQWQNAQAYTSTKPTVTTAEVTADGFRVKYLHKNAWKGIVLKNVEYDITGLSLLSFTYTEEMDITEYRVHVLTDKGGSLENNTSGTPSNYYAAIKIGNIAQSSIWTRTTNADDSITVTFDLTTLPFFAEGTKLLGMDIVTVTETGTTGTVTYKSIEIR